MTPCDLRSRKAVLRHVRRIAPFPPGYVMQIVLGVNANRTCNLRCQYCNRLLDVISTPGCDVSAWQFRQALRVLQEEKIYVRRVKINGGEPTLNPDLVHMCRAARSCDNVCRVSVSTNGTTTAPQLPRGVRYRTSPPGGREKQEHEPFLISPEDLGMPDEWRTKMSSPCSFMATCGRCFDREGFTFCLAAGGLGRLLGRNVYSPRPVLNRDPEICRHCLYSIGPQKLKEIIPQLAADVASGRLAYPSPTFAKGIARWNSGETSPYPLPPWGG